MSREADTVSRLLAKNGEPVAVSFPGVPAYDPVTGEAGAGTSPTTYTANGYPSQYQSSEVDGTVILASDTRLILELIPRRPEAGCSAIVDSKTHRVMNVRPIRKAGRDVAYICQLRRN